MYEFICDKCDTCFEELVSLSERTPPPCPKCGAKEVKRVLSTVCARVEGGDAFSAPAGCGSGGFS